MKKYFLIFGLFIIGLSSCKKAAVPFDAAAQAALDDALIQAYIKQNNAQVTKDPSGLYYQIINPGTGPHPNDNSNISVGYTMTLIDGTPIDSRSSSYFAMNQFVQGFRTGMSLIGTGGKIFLLVPSALGYGNTNGGAVPANSVLVFNVTLQGFN